MVRSVTRDLPEQVKNNQCVNPAAGNGGQKMNQYSWFTVYLGGSGPRNGRMHQGGRVERISDEAQSGGESDEYI